MQHLKSLTLEKDRVRRKRRLGPDMYNPLDPTGAHDNSLEGDDDDDDDDKPMMAPGSNFSQVCNGVKTRLLNPVFGSSQ